MRYTAPNRDQLAVDTGTNGILDSIYVGWNLVSAPHLHRQPRRGEAGVIEMRA